MTLGYFTLSCGVFGYSSCSAIPTTDAVLYIGGAFAAACALFAGVLRIVNR